MSPGTYTVTVQAGAARSTRTVEVRGDPGKPAITLAQYQSARGISPRCIRSAAKGGSTDQSIESRTGVTSPDSATQHAGSRLQRQRFAPGHAVRTDCRTAAHARGIEKERWSRKILMATRSEEKHLSLVPLGCLCLPKSRLPANPARPTGDLKALGGSVSDGRPKDAGVRLARLNGCRNEFRVPGNR